MEAAKQATKHVPHLKSLRNSTVQSVRFLGLGWERGAAEHLEHIQSGTPLRTQFVKNFFHA